jgi:hypothetical protein
MRQVAIVVKVPDPKGFFCGSGEWIGSKISPRQTSSLGVKKAWSEV